MIQSRLGLGQHYGFCHEKETIWFLKCIIFLVTFSNTSSTTASHRSESQGAVEPSSREAQVKHTYCNHNQLSQSLTYIPPDQQYKYIQLVVRSQKILEQCGFYYMNFDMKASRRKLKHCPEGNFLVRDSSDPKHLFSLSVKTSRGPTSVRIVYRHGSFHLDCETSQEAKMVKFQNVMDLIQYYVKNSEKNAKEKSQCYWLETGGRKEIPVVLKRPQHYRISSLQHLCRLNIHKQCDTAESNDLLSQASPRLYNYLMDYPYWL